MSRRIPPLNPLHVFETAARLGNFTRAADELHVTQSAVSRQISALEGYLRVKLFERDRGGVSLTPTGQALFAEVGPAFARIADATERIIYASITNRVRVRAYTTFVAKWLMPRLSLFQEQHPSIEVILSTDTRAVDFSRDEVDLAIQVVTGDWPGANVEPLFPDTVEPVCSPALLSGPFALHTPDHLRHHRMLHAHYRRDDWSDWLSFIGRPDLMDNNKSMTFTSSILTYQAAIEGLGVAMGQVRLLEQELASNALVRPFAMPLHRKAAYSILTPADRSLPAGTAIFRAWLLAQAAGDGAPVPGASAALCAG
jgi:LysR family glycine cleavage system transcriptional activator